MFEEPPEDAAPVPGADGWAVPGVPRQRQPEPPPVAWASVQAGVAALAAVDVARLGDQEALQHTRLLIETAQQLHLLGVAGLAQVHQRHLHDLDGSGTTARWASAHGLDDRRDISVAKRLSAFPEVAERVIAGSLPMPAAHALQSTLVKLRPHLDRPDGLIDGRPGQAVLEAVLVGGVRMLVAEARGGFPAEDDPALRRLLSELPRIAAGQGSELARVEAALLLLAELVEPTQLAGCLGLLVDALLPEQLEQAARRSHDRRSLRLVRDVDGNGWHLTGSLDLQAGERLHLLLQAELLRDPDGALDTETAARLRGEGIDPYSGELAPTSAPRSRAQRLHDALDRGLGRYLADGLGGVHDKNPVQIVVTVPVETVDGRPAPLPARTGSGTTVPASLFRRWVCGSAIARHVLDLRGKVIADSHAERTLTRRERRALHTQTGGHCQGYGCGRSTRDPGTILHPHHADPWSRCGTTSLADTVLLCDSCHRHVHHGHVLRLKDGRRLGPDGWVERLLRT